MISRMLSFVAAMAVLLVSGMLYKSLATDSEQLDRAVASMARVPMEIGDWKGTDAAEDEIDARAFAQAGAKGHWTRTYVNERNKVSVLAILMCGRSGKMAVHSPEVCYHGAGYQLTGQPVVSPIKNELGDELGRFWTGDFGKKSGLTTGLRLYWGWNVHGAWEAPENPRLHFRGEPFLYKLYLSRDLNPHQRSADPRDDPAYGFLRPTVARFAQSHAVCI